MSVNFAPSSGTNANVLTNPAEEAKKYKSIAFKADLKAKISIVALAVLTITGVTLAAIFLPTLVPVMLIIAGAAVKKVHSTYYLKYRAESKKFSEFAEHMLGVAQKVDTYQKKNFNGADYFSKLYDLGINPRAIQNHESLGETDPTKDIYSPLKNLIGRVEYWSEAADRYKGEIQELDKKIQQKAELMNAPGNDLDKHRKIKSAWLLLNIQKHQVEEEKYIPAKLAAAYNLHVIDNVKDNKEYSSFGHPEPSSYLDSVTFKDASAQPYYVFTSDAERAPLSKQWMMDQSVQKIARNVFGGSAIMVA